MDKKEFKVCIWIHHIATFAGLAAGISVLTRKRQGKKKSVWKKAALLLYIISQIWAAFKIAVSFLSGKEQMKDSYDNIHSLCDDSRKEKMFTWFLTMTSACAKIGIPAALR